MNKDEIIEKIPEYLNGTLSSSDNDIIKAAADRDNSIRLEIEFMKSIQEQVLLEKIESPTEWGWARLKQNIERQRIEENKQKEKTDSHSDTTTTRTIKPVWKKFAIAASFAFAIQSGYLVQQEVFNKADYQLLSTENLKNSIQIQFSEGTSEQAIRQLLIDTEGNIISGPSALGIYTVEFKDREAALTRLNDSIIIEYAELSE